MRSDPLAKARAQPPRTQAQSRLARWLVAMRHCGEVSPPDQRSGDPYPADPDPPPLPATADGPIAARPLKPGRCGMRGELSPRF